MRFAAVLAAVAALWAAQPASALTIIDFENDTPGTRPTAPRGVGFRNNPVVVAGGPSGNYVHLDAGIYPSGNYIVAKNFRNYDVFPSENQETYLVGFDIRADQDGYIQIDGGKLIPLVGGEWVRFDNVVEQTLKFRNTGISLDNIGYEFGIVHGVPEPSTWAMMILGLGLTGAALRRRTKRYAVAT